MREATAWPVSNPDPCPVCLSDTPAHSCPVAFTQPHTVAYTYTDAGPVTHTYPCAFSRALRDA